MLLGGCGASIRGASWLFCLVKGSQGHQGVLPEWHKVTAEKSRMQKARAALIQMAR